MSNKVIWFFIILTVVLLVWGAVETNRSKRLDTVDYDEIEQRLGEEDFQGAFEVLLGIVKRHHGGWLPSW